MIRPQLEEAARSADPEVAERAARVLTKLQFGTRGQMVRKLMAIRTVGERKLRAALPILRRLTGSKDFFIADYARAAIAAVEGKPYHRQRPTAKELDEDLSLLPATCRAVLQNRLGFGPPRPLADIMAEMNPDDAPADADVTRKQITRTLLDAARMVGNVRLDAITVGVTGSPDDRLRFCILTRGRYDLPLVRTLLKRSMPHPFKLGSQHVHAVDDRTPALMPLTDRQLVVIAPPEGLEATVGAAAGSARHPGLKANAAMMARVQAVDRTRPLWGVAAGELFAGTPDRSAFSRFELTAEVKGGRVHLRLLARGTDAAKVTAALADIKQTLARAGKRIAIEAGRQPYARPIRTLLLSIRIRQEETDLVVTAGIPREPSVVAPSILSLIRMATLPSVTDDEPEAVDRN